MKKYIGSKIVTAEPMRRSDWHESKGWPIPMEEGWDREGYKVRYEDGYESWSPKEVFEAAYRRTDGMSFGLALEAVKKGFRIARQGWNGKGQYVELGHEIYYEDANGDGWRAVHEDIGSQALVFCGSRGRQMGWLASQADMLADDWMILEG